MNASYSLIIMYEISRNIMSITSLISLLAITVSYCCVCLLEYFLRTRGVSIYPKNCLCSCGFKNPNLFILRLFSRSLSWLLILCKPLHQNWNRSLSWFSTLCKPLHQNWNRNYRTNSPHQSLSLRNYGDLYSWFLHQHYPYQ